MDVASLTGAAFVVVGLGLLLLERLARGRDFARIPWTRWLTNLGLMICGGIASALIVAGDLVSVAADLDRGLIADLYLPLGVEIVAVFLFLDFWRYWEHRLLHEVPLLWRLHLVHHSDTEVDVTTGQRHHPLESVLTTVLMLILLFSLGFSPVALGIYLLLGTVAALYTHTSLALPESVDRQLRYWLVTPSVHGVHHSDHQPQTDSNYGSVLSVWDRLFGTYTDPALVRVERVGLDQFRGPADTTLAAALLQPLEYRTGGDASCFIGAAPASTTAPAVLGQWRGPLFTGGAGVLLVLLAMWPAAQDMLLIWSTSDPYRYAWLVLPTFVYLLGWHHREALLATSPAPGFAGVPVVACALLLWLFSSVVDIRLGQHLALVVALQGVALCTLGWPAYRRLLPVMLLLFLAVPSGDLLQPVLRELTVQWIEWFALAMDFPLSRDGYTVYIGEHRYVVIDACSGLATFTLAGFLGYSFGAMLYRSLPRVLAFAALGGLIAILSNALRVCTIVALDYLQGSQMSLEEHGDVQLVLLLVVLGLLLYLTCRLPGEARPVEALPGNRRTVGEQFRGQRISYAPMTVGALVAVVIGTFQWLSPVPVVHAGSVDSPLRDLAANYRDSQWMGEPAGGILELPVSPGLDARIHVSPTGAGRMPERLMVRPHGEGWRHSATRSHRDCSANGCIDFTEMVWTRAGISESRHSFHAYFVGETLTRSKLRQRLLSGWLRLWGSRDTTGVLAFLSSGDPATHELADRFGEMHRLVGTGARAR